MSLIQNSKLKLTAAETAALGKDGFVISAAHAFPSFTHAYAEIYAADLPVYVTADSIVSAVHESYDYTLMTLEGELLRGELEALLKSLLRKLRAQPSDAASADLDTYLSVSQTLLTGAKPVGTGAARVSALVASARAASGASEIRLFGRAQDVDFSQFTPRGHYADEPRLQDYFRAVMWLGRVELRLLTARDDGTPELHRAALDAALRLQALFDDADRQHLDRIDQILRAFLGDSDNLTTDDIARLRRALPARDAAGVAKLPDETIVAAINDVGRGKNLLNSGHSPHGANANAVASYLLLGQRYVVDSDVFENVVWPNVRSKRMMPDPLDAAFAVFDNDQAWSLLADNLHAYRYEPQLLAVRARMDAHTPEYWRANLYNRWLSTLRSLSPQTAALEHSESTGMPGVTTTEAWGRRILNTQLSSWAQLRHDTLLYAKPSFTGEAMCEFPDAAVDPYPEFYAGVASMAEQGFVIAALTRGTSASQFGDYLRTYFEHLRQVSLRLQDIAQRNLRHEALTPDQLAFMNEAVVIKHVSAGCTSIEKASGWYPRLFLNSRTALYTRPVIADVHTQPTDADGNRVGRVLHVATGHPRAMVVTQDGCGTPRAYVGVVASYYEVVTEGLKRLDDSDWATQLEESPAPADVRWFGDLIRH